MRWCAGIGCLSFTAFVLSVFAATSVAGPRGASAVQDTERLPKDVHPESRSRLPPRASGSPGEPPGAAAIRRYGSGAATLRWDTPLERPLLELAILITAREHDQPFEWSLHEMEAVAVGLDPDVIDIVRHGRPLTGLRDREAIIIQLGREVFGRHRVASDTYSRALALLGQKTLVDVVALMGQYAGTAALLTAFNQHMPPGWPQFLPLPFVPADDIHPDSRSRLPLRQGPAERRQVRASQYGRTLSPEGTGPPHLRRHGAGVESLSARVEPHIRDLAILVTAREYDAQYDWTLAELAALEHGLPAATIDVIRHRQPVAGLEPKQAALVRFGREVLRDHNVGANTYADVLRWFGTRDLVDLVQLMGEHAADAALLIAFDQHLPAGQPPLLPTSAL